MDDGDRILDPFALPLQSVRLVEASAGTGKTYTLSLIYLRCLLERGLSVDRILVVTFTNAATEELRSRIRGRMVEAALALETGHCDDESLRRLLDQAGDPAAALDRIRDALLRLDEAGIFTIHGFCGQMLQDNAFESGILFDTELLPDESDLRLRVLEDFWRRGFYGGPALVAEWAYDRWESPEGLLGELQPMLLRPLVRLVPAVEPGAVERALGALERQFEATARRWRQDGADVAGILRSHPHLSRAEKNYREDVLEEALRVLDNWLTGPPSSVMPKTLGRFTAEHLAAGCKKSGDPPAHTFFAQFSGLAAVVDGLDRLLGIQVIHQAYDFLAAEMTRRKSREGQFSYDDLLARLAAALAAPGGDLLAERIRERFPVAMVDEFQDTDPLQYGIFRRVYGEVAGTGIFFIGDPKQAIYGFRGADVFTYMAARRAAGAGKRYTLDTNWRSAARLVSAVNRIFARAASPFVYDRDIPFHEVRAGGLADREPLLLDGRPMVPLQFRFARRDDTNRKRHGALGSDWAEEAVPAACAVEVARLLAQADEGRLRLGDRALAAGDVAVLVRDHRDAHAVQQALSVVGVGGVVMSRESVFTTPEARQLARVLEAVAEPHDARRLRAALCVDLLGGNGTRLYDLSRDEAILEPLVMSFREAHRRWLERGFMVMFMYLLSEHGVAQRLLAREDGERRLTNLVQLGELLQQAAGEHHTMESLLRWMTDQRDDPDAGAEDQQLRLESDENLVQIVTIHRSKGLEYPVVLLPYLWKSRPVKLETPLAFHDGDIQCFDLGSDELEDRHQLAERERLAEDLRLLYVALTRARHLCIPFWGYFTSAPDSAMAHVLHGAGAMKGMEDEALMADLADLTTGAGDAMAVADLDTGPVPAVAGVRDAASLDVRRFGGAIDRRWRIHSYTGLAGQGTAPTHERLGEPDVGDEGERPAAFQSIFDFPRGARAGTFFHELLEHLDFPTARNDALGAGVERHLARYGFDPGWRTVVAGTVSAVLDTPLVADGSLRLRDIPRTRRLDEMAFHYPLMGADAARLGRLLADGGESAIGIQGLYGLMKGYVDLVFEHRGRFYLADYKSNHLGSDPADYDIRRLRAEMAAHRYDMQYRIYTLALHRYLEQRLPEYDYERHFGGVFYLFLRGMSPDTGAAGGVVFERPTAALVARLDDAVRGAGT